MFQIKEELNVELREEGKQSAIRPSALRLDLRTRMPVNISLWLANIFLKSPIRRPFLEPEYNCPQIFNNHS